MQHLKHLKLEQLVASVVEDLGYQFVGLEYLSQGKYFIIRLYIDKIGGVSTEDCEKVSFQVNSVLNVETNMYNNYTLEVSSPGLDRKLFNFKQCLDYIGSEVKVRLKSHVTGMKRFKGILHAAKNGNLFLIVDGTEVQVAFDDIERVNIIPKW